MGRLDNLFLVDRRGMWSGINGMMQRVLIVTGLLCLLMLSSPVGAVETQDNPVAEDPQDIPEEELRPGSGDWFGISPGTRFQDCVQCPEMVVIPPGSFQMGSPEDERGRSNDEGPVHEVTFRRPFAIGRYEVTIAQWQACVDARACVPLSDDRRGGGPDRPVVNVSWKDTQEYVRWLSRISGKIYRLPSEAEWEYAARGGTSTPRYWAERAVACAFANVYDISGQRVHQFEWPHFTCIDANSSTATVGNYVPNNYGLHDMLGNVWEWVQDCWNDSYANAPVNGRPNLQGDCGRRVVRGGSWKNVAWATRSAFRGWQDLNDRIDANGFRVARFGR